MDDQDEFSVFSVNAQDMEPRVFSQRTDALERFRQCVGNGRWCEVWEGTVGVNSVTKIADFPGLT